MPYEAQTEEMRIAIARRDVAESAATYDARIAARLDQFAAAHGATDANALDSKTFRKTDFMVRRSGARVARSPTPNSPNCRV